MSLSIRRLVSCTLVFYLIALPASAATFTVDDTGDGADDNPGNGICATSGGVCTLRAAIEEANALGGEDTIEFNISGIGPHTIQSASALPAIIEPVYIQGDSEPDYVSSPVVVLDGQNAGSSASGLTFNGVTGSNSIVDALSIINFGSNGILLDNAENVLIYKSYIGVAADGSAAGNGGNGIEITNGSSFISVGVGTTNVISNNGLRGIFIGAAGGEANNLINGNLIGLDPSGTQNMGNTYEGIVANGATNTTIGGASASDRNVIAGNGRRGILIVGGDATIEGNYVGTNAAGDAAIANAQDGIELQGGAAPVAVTDNVISGNDAHGLEVIDNGTQADIKGNYIGTNAAGNAAMYNGNHGVWLGSFSASSTVGGTASGSANVIASVGGGTSLSLFSNGNTVQGNYLGTNANGDVLGFGNSMRVGGDNNTIGGASSGAANIIATPISGEGSGNVIKGNYIGTNPSGDNLAGGTGTGIDLFSSASNNVIGGTGSGEGNVIAFHATGVALRAAFSNAPKGNTIRGNTIYQNTLGIDLANNGTSSNDAGDSDTGANRLQNFPEIQSADYDSGADEITVTYQVPSDPSLTGSGAPAYNLTIDFYRADANGSGKAYLGTASYTASDYDGCVSLGGTAPCPKTVTFTPAASVSRTDDIVATATDNNGNTSEFSANAVQLPVELTAFEARADEGAVQLTWQTASETKNAGFEVQRKTADAGFQTLTFVEGAGTTSRPQRYAYEDAAVSLEHEAATYRLKQVDIDGAFTYSREVEVALQRPTAFTLQPSFPNPAHRQATIRYALPRATDVQLVVYDVLGRRVKTLVNGAKSSGRHEVTLRVSQLPTGVYVYRLKAGGHVEMRRLTIVR